MSFAIYLIGFLILIAGVAWGMTVLGVAQVYVLITCVILLGLGLLSGAVRTRAKDPPE